MKDVFTAMTNVLRFIFNIMYIGIQNTKTWARGKIMFLPHNLGVSVMWCRDMGSELFPTLSDAYVRLKDQRIIYFNTFRELHDWLK